MAKLLKTFITLAIIMIITQPAIVKTMQEYPDNNPITASTKIIEIAQKDLDEDQKIEKIEQIIKNDNFDITKQENAYSDPNFYKLLDLACQKGYLKIVKFLLTKNIDINYSNGYNRPCLMTAVLYEQPEIIKILVNHGAIPDYYWECKWINSSGSALQLAIKVGSLKIVNFLVEHISSDINSLSINELLLSCASEYGHLDIVNFFIDKGVNIKGSNSCTALHEAARNGHLNIVKALVEAGATLDGQPKVFNGNTPLHLAACGGYEKIVTFLIQKGASVNQVNKQKKTPLMCAAHYPRCMKILIKNGADIHQTGLCNKSALHYCAYKGAEDTFKFLVQQGANIFAAEDMSEPLFGRYNQYVSALDTAKSNGISYASLAKAFYNTNKNMDMFGKFIEKYCTKNDTVKNVIDIYNLKHLGCKTFIDQFDNWLKTDENIVKANTRWAQDRKWMWFDLMQGASDIKNKLALLPLLFPPIRNKNSSAIEQKTAEYAFTVDLDDLDDTIALKKKIYEYIRQNRLNDVVCKTPISQTKPGYKLYDCKIFCNK